MPSMSERRLPDMVEGPLIHGMIEVLLQDRIQFPTRLLSRQVLNVLRYFNMSMSQSVDLNAKVIRFMRDAAQPFTSRELSRAHNGFSETENIGVIHYQLSMLVANGAVSRLKIYAYERPNELTYIGPVKSLLYAVNFVPNCRIPTTQSVCTANSFLKSARDEMVRDSLQSGKDLRIMTAAQNDLLQGQIREFSNKFGRHIEKMGF